VDTLDTARVKMTVRCQGRETQKFLVKFFFNFFAIDLETRNVCNAPEQDVGANNREVGRKNLSSFFKYKTKNVN
jgi:hypothetical protein